MCYVKIDKVTAIAYKKLICTSLELSIKCAREKEGQFQCPQTSYNLVFKGTLQKEKSIEVRVLKSFVTKSAKILVQIYKQLKENIQCRLIGQPQMKGETRG